MDRADIIYVFCDGFLNDSAAPYVDDWTWEERRDTLRNLSLVNSTWRGFAQAELFRKIYLGINQEQCMRAVDVLRRPHIGIYIREFFLGGFGMIPKQDVRSIKGRGGLSRVKRIKLLMQIQQWVARYTVNMVKLFTACPRLRTIDLDFAIETSKVKQKTLCWDVNVGFISAVIEAVTSCELPMLRCFRIVYADTKLISNLLESINSPGYRRLQETFDQITDFSFNLEKKEIGPWGEDNKTCEQLMKLVSKPTLQHLSLGLGTHSYFDINIWGLLDCTNLMEFDLSSISIADSLGYLLKQMPKLKRIGFRDLQVSPRADTFEHIFKCIEEMEYLEHCVFVGLRYTECDGGKFHENTSFCTTRERDAFAFNNLLQTKLSQGWGPDWFYLESWKVCPYHVLA